MNASNRKILLIGALCLLVFALAWRRGRARAARESDSPTQPGTVSVSLEFGGRTRTYLLHVPPASDPSTRFPLVFVLHGATQSPNSAEKMSGMSAKGDREHFISVYPTGTGRLSDVPTWNAGNCCGYAIDPKPRRRYRFFSNPARKA